MDTTIQKLIDWSDQYVSSDDNTLKRKLYEYKRKFSKITDAKNVKPAIGVFGPSQCGKSHLISKIVGHDIFFKYNEENVGGETTAAVTRYTTDKSNNCPDDHFKIKLMDIDDITWSFIRGFINENDVHKMRVTISTPKDIISRITNLNSNGGDFQKDKLNLFIDNFNAWRHFCEKAFDSKAKKDLAEVYNAIENKLKKMTSISANDLAYVSSCFWFLHPETTNAYETLIKHLNRIASNGNLFINSADIKNIINIRSKQRFKFTFDSKDTPKTDSNNIISMGTSDSNLYLQSLTKEVVIHTDTSDDLMKKLDLLDFPGTRAGGNYKNVTTHDAEDRQLQITDIIRRGRLMHLFYTNCISFDITTLLFCSGAENQEAAITSNMLSEWLENNKDKNRKASLFVAMTKSDMMIPKANDEIITKRFTENFVDTYSKGSQEWIDDFHGENKPFRNFYFIRNPLHSTHCYEYKKDKTESYNKKQKGKEQIDALKGFFINHPLTKKYLGKSIEKIFDECFVPGKNGGLDYLAKSMLNDFDEYPNKKKSVLEAAEKDIENGIKSFIDEYLPESSSDAQKKDRKKAIKFMESIKKRPENITILLNHVINRYPEGSHFFALYNSITDDLTSNGSILRVTTNKKYLRLIKDFISDWMERCEVQMEDIQQSDIDKYLEKMTNYLQSEYVIGKLQKAIQSYLNEDDSKTKKLIWDNLHWICSDHLHRLGIPNNKPILEGPLKVESVINDEDDNYVIYEHIKELHQIWDKRLPEIYAEHYVEKETVEGQDQLMEINNDFMDVIDEGS